MRYVLEQPRDAVPTPIAHVLRTLSRNGDLRNVRYMRARYPRAGHSYRLIDIAVEYGYVHFLEYFGLMRIHWPSFNTLRLNHPEIHNWLTLPSQRQLLHDIVRTAVGKNEAYAYWLLKHSHEKLRVAVAEILDDGLCRAAEVATWGDRK